MSRGPAVPVLMYHDVGTGVDRSDPFTISVGELAEQLDALAVAGWTTRQISRIADDPGDGRVAYLTFDDAFSSFATAVVPLLVERAMCATVFVPTGWIGRPAAWAGSSGGPPPSVLGWDQLRALDPDVVEIGAHGHSHVACDLLATDALQRELTSSRQLLERRLHRPVTSMAYPFGYHDRRVRRAAVHAGYRVACEVGYAQHHRGDDPLRVRRLLVGPGVGGRALLDLLVTGQRTPLRMAAVRVARPAARGLRHWQARGHQQLVSVEHDAGAAGVGR